MAQFHAYIENSDLSPEEKFQQI